MSLQKPTKKMSKSDPDARASILITDAPDAVRNKVMASLTDPTNAVTYDPGARPGVSNLVELLALLDGRDRTPQLVAAELEGASLKQLKERVAEVLVWRLEGIRERFLEALEEDEGRYLDHVQEQGARRAQERAAETMQSVREAVGL
jgi:tryptophanyl-tRNA synthetase